MNQIKFLNNILYIIFILGIVVLLVLPFYLAFSNSIIINGERISEWTNVLIGQGIVKVITYLIILIGIYKLKLMVNNFILFKTFNEFISHGFKQLGILVLIVVLWDFTANTLIELIFENDVHINLNAVYLIYVAVAYFFFMLSTMVKIAQDYQEENKLTV